MSKLIHAGCVSLATLALMLGGCVAGTDSDAGGADESPAADAPAIEPQGDEIGWVDLIPVGDPYCNGFRVKNIGNMTSGASTLRVKYSWLIGVGVYDVETQYFSVPPLAAGATAYFYYYPEACYDSDADCDFSMRADYWGNVSEWNESNNTLTTSCTF